VKFLPELDETISFAHYSENGLNLTPKEEVEGGSVQGKFSEETIRAGMSIHIYININIYIYVYSNEK
jgi:hypothetical protein